MEARYGNWKGNENFRIGDKKLRLKIGKIEKVLNKKANSKRGRV